MLKNKKSLICVIVFLLITLISTFCFADNEVAESTTDQAAEAVTTSEEVTDATTDEAIDAETDTSLPEIHEGDLYLFGTDVTMDQLVDGNVYIFANNVTVTGQVAGNMYVFANRVTFTDAYIQYSTYITATIVEFGAVTTDLYANCMQLNVPGNYGAYRDMLVNAQTAYISGVAGRNVTVNASHLSLEKDGTAAMIYGDFTYTSPNEINIPEGAVEGEVQYSQETQTEMTVADQVQKYSIMFFSAFITALILYLLARFCAKKSTGKAVQAVSNKWLPTFGIGLLGIILVPIVSIILILTLIGIPAALLLLAFYVLLLFISIPAITVILAKIMANKFKIDRVIPQILILLIVSIILSAIFLIPYVGIIVKLILAVLGFGAMLTAMFFKNSWVEKKEKKEAKKKENKTVKEEKKEDKKETKKETKKEEPKKAKESKESKEKKNK